MDELKQLAEIVKDLPTIGLFILAAYFFYKMFIIGSVFAITRFLIGQLTGSYNNRVERFTNIRQTEAETSKERVVNESLDRHYATIKHMVINEEMPSLLVQIGRLIGKGTNVKTQYVHNHGVDWLRQAIDEKEQRDQGEINTT